MLGADSYAWFNEHGGMTAANGQRIFNVQTLVDEIEKHPTDELTLDLLVANQRFPLDLISAVINAIASLGMAPAASSMPAGYNPNSLSGLY